MISLSTRSDHPYQPEPEGLVLLTSSDVPPGLVCVEVRGQPVAVAPEVLEWDVFAREAHFVERAVFAAEGHRLLALFEHAELLRAEATGDAEADDPWDVVASSLSASIAVSSRVASDLVATAKELFERLPETAKLLRFGWIGQDTARVVAEATQLVGDDLIAELDHEIAGSLGPSRRRINPPRTGPLKRQLRKLVDRRDPTAVRARAELARGRVGCRVRPLGDDLAQFVATLPADWAVELGDRIDGMANRAVREADAEAQPVGMVRGRALMALVRGASPGDRLGSTMDETDARRVVLHTYYDGRTGESDGAMWLRGYGPVSPFTFEALESSVEVRETPIRQLADPTSDAALRYTPGAELRLFVHGRDGSCVFPGCTVSAEHCQLDHIEPFNHDDPSAGGRTTSDNLASLCPHHHERKTMGSWLYWRDTAGGYTWVHGPNHPRRQADGRWYTEPDGPLAHLSRPWDPTVSGRQSAAAVTGENTPARLYRSLREQRRQRRREYVRRCAAEPGQAWTALKDVE